MANGDVRTFISPISEWGSAALPERRMLRMLGLDIPSYILESSSRLTFSLVRET